MPSCINGSCGLGPSECQSCAEAERNPPPPPKLPTGRGWNERLKRRLADSYNIACDVPRPGKLLLTDVSPEKLVGPFDVLVEVLDDKNERVIAEFLVQVDLRPKTPRYRDDRSWPR